MKIGISQLIKAIGNDRINYQILNHAITSIRTAKAHSTISFKTDAVTAVGELAGTNKVGLIIWVDEAVFNAELKKLKKESA